MFTVNKADGTKVYELTDPVIHQRPSGKKSERRIMNFGRTDRGILGMNSLKVMNVTVFANSLVCQK